MARYTDQVFDEYKRPVEGAAVHVFTPAGAIVDLTDDGGFALANPVTTDTDGIFYFNAPEAQYELEVRFSGQLEYRELIWVGAAAAAIMESFIIACSDETTAITTGTAKVTIRMPYAFNLSAVQANVNIAPTGAPILIDINENGVSILSTKLMINAASKTSLGAATPYVLSDHGLAADAEITIDFDQVGSTIAGAGVKVCLIGTQ